MKRSLLLLLLCVPLLACQSVPSRYAVLGKSDELTAFIGRHRHAADALEQQGAWREAMRQWELIQAVSPDDDVVERQLRRLRAKVDHQFSVHRAAALTAKERGRYRESREQLLKALALRPDDRELIADLKAVQARLAYAAMPVEPTIEKGKQTEVDVYTAQREQMRKTSPSAREVGHGDVRALPDNSETNPGSGAVKPGDDGRYEVALAHLQRLRQAKGPDPQIDAQIAKLRSLLAEQHYERGVAAFRAARYHEAVGEFDRALQYEPDHHKARLYRSSAEALDKP